MGVVGDVMAWVKDFSSSPWFYAIIFVVAVLDSILPIVPSETLVIVGGVAAGAGDLSIVGVIAAGLSGAFLGDNLSYLIGREASDRVTRRQTRTEKGRARFEREIGRAHV